MNTSSSSASAQAAPPERSVHRSQEEMDMPYAVIKMFTDFGYQAGKPLAPAAVEEMSSFWGNIQQLVATQQFSVALAKRCVNGTARKARELAGNAPLIGGTHVREAISMVQAESTATAGFICRLSG